MHTVSVGVDIDNVPKQCAELLYTLYRLYYNLNK